LCWNRHVRVGIDTSVLHNDVLGRSPLPGVSPFVLCPSSHVERQPHIAQKREAARNVVVFVQAIHKLWNVRVVGKVKKEYINDLLDIFEVLPGWRGLGLGLRLERQWRSTSMCSCGAEMSNTSNLTCIVNDDAVDGPDLVS
jgi:hypothetical protein